MEESAALKRRARGPAAERPRGREGHLASAHAGAGAQRTRAPAEACATLLDEGRYLCSIRTMCRVLADNDEARERQGKLEKITPEILPYPEPAGHTEEIRQFIEAIRKSKPSPVPGEEALITQRILDGMYKSGEAGKEVEV